MPTRLDNPPLPHAATAPGTAPPGSPPARGAGIDRQARFPDLGIAVETVPITSLRGYKRALKKHSKRNIEQLVASIQTFGFVQPIVVDAGGEIIAGHGLLAAAKQAGFREVPVIRLEHLDEAAVRALRIAL